MFNDDGELEYNRMRKARNRPASNYVSFGGIQFDAETTTALFYGLSAGL